MLRAREDVGNGGAGRTRRKPRSLGMSSGAVGIESRGGEEEQREVGA